MLEEGHMPSTAMANGANATSSASTTVNPSSTTAAATTGFATTAAPRYEFPVAKKTRREEAGMPAVA